MDIKCGDVFRVKFPFVSFVYSGYDIRGEFQEESWRPGCKSVFCPPDDTEWLANAEGEMILSVIDTFKPGKYPQRVFYTRKFIDPEGKEFGSSKLHVTTMPTFKRRASGYYHEYKLSDEIEE